MSIETNLIGVLVATTASAEEGATGEIVAVYHHPHLGDLWVAIDISFCGEGVELHPLKGLHLQRGPGGHIVKRDLDTIP
jgi:hypothetical protein